MWHQEYTRTICAREDGVSATQSYVLGQNKRSLPYQRSQRSGSCLVCGALLEQSEVNLHQWFEQTNRVWTQEDITVGECVLLGSS